jgi:hypothetical protein
LPDLPSPHPTNTRDGAALLSERFAGRAVERRSPEPSPEVPIAEASIAARLIASWFAPARAVEEGR